MSRVATEDQIALIGAGPSGLAGARCLDKLGIPFQGFEAHTDVGGLWNIENPRSTVYDSAHLISSKRTTEFSEFPSRLNDFSPCERPKYIARQATSSSPRPQCARLSE